MGHECLDFMYQNILGKTTVKELKKRHVLNYMNESFLKIDWR